MKVSLPRSVIRSTPVVVLVSLSILAGLSRDVAAADMHGFKPAAPLAGLAATIVPAVTGDLAKSRPAIDLRVVGQSLGEPSPLRLYKLPHGPAVGSSKPSFVGLK